MLVDRGVGEAERLSARSTRSRRSTSCVAVLGTVVERSSDRVSIPDVAQEAFEDVTHGKCRMAGLQNGRIAVPIRGTSVRQSCNPAILTHSSSTERGHDRRVVAGADVRLHRTADGARGERLRAR